MRRMWNRLQRDPVSVIAAQIARMSLRESTLLDELWSKRHPRSPAALVKRRHKQFMTELTAYYSCICEDFLETELPAPAEHFMNLVVDEVAREATRDGFIAKAPYFVSDLEPHREKRYSDRIQRSRSKMRLIPPYVKPEWLAARTALELRRIITAESDDPNELSMIEVALFQRLQWTALELTGE